MQMIGIHSIEDCLEILTGLQKHNLEFKIDPSDATIMNSIARQVFKGTALTDRQYNLMKEKLQNYKEQFESQEVIGFDRAVSRLRNPLREIDRSKYIKLVDTVDVYGQDNVHESYKSKWKWIKIRFPFAKKLIVLIEECTRNSMETYYHQRGSHEHYFKFNEKNTLNICDRFLNKNFIIESEIEDFYNEIKRIQKNRHEIVPRLSSDKIYNLPSSATMLIEKEIKNVDKENYFLLADRKRRYGLVDINTDINHFSPTVNSIIQRENAEILLSKKDYQSSDVYESIHLLDRYPLLVVLDKEKAEEQLYECFNFFKNIIDNTEQSVLFRLDDPNNEFNKMIKTYSLNNWVDKSTKIVYISSTNKIPKVLFKSNFSPIACLCFNSRFNRQLDLYIKEKCDLIVYREEDISPFRRYSHYYG